ncbi:arabinan endo-1,5-alpha-L-arabinosidase [Evansella vedderi]|uniref:Endo-alpha-(1->5)-L-arabinanase n=2 Tax=Evansella vedderi TaxID=38282 RepID=A0ABT9ZVQ5_9BACI|nr:arabinan endo-1,5-alpha-L-arabinosidase [Evansella vedderi]
MMKIKYLNFLLLLVFIIVTLIACTTSNTPDSDNTTETSPVGKLTMIGDYGDFVPGEIDDPVHDPALFKDGNTYYVVSTGILNPQNPGGIYLRKSTGTLEGPWEALGEIPVPEWTHEYNHEHLWAPQVVRNDNTFYMYYAVSSFGSNNSAIGVMSTETPEDLNSWIDHGPVITSQTGMDFNAIDPSVMKDEGKWWITFGSYWTGIKLQQLDENMTEPIGEVYDIASRPNVQHNPIEAPTVFKKDEYYYLLTSWDRCCAGLDSTYKIAVGRSESITGPYYDKEGVPLMEGGGTVILDSHDNQIGPGGQDYFHESGIDYLIYHYYDGDANGVIRMQIWSMDWEDGWPFFN